jgi:hypothetical protein
MNVGYTLDSRPSSAPGGRPPWEGGLDRDSVARPHSQDVLGELGVVAVLPDPFFDKPVELVLVVVPEGTDKPELARWISEQFSRRDRIRRPLVLF